MSGYSANRNYFSEIRSILDNEDMRLIRGLSSPSSSEQSGEVTDFERNLELILDQVSLMISSEKKNLESIRTESAKAQSEFRAEMSNRISAALARKKRFEENAERAEKARVHSEDIIEICVGGDHFITTTRQTLTQQENSALTAMFSGRHPIQSHKGKAFIDRDPEAFIDMINYLRTNSLPIFKSSEQETRLMEELHYWGIHLYNPQNEVDQSLRCFDPEWCASTLILEKNNTVIKKIGTPHGISFGTNSLSASCPYVEFKISITSPSSNGSHIFLGVVNKSKYKSSQLVSTLWRDAPASWYWDIWSSKLIKTDDNGVHTVFNGYGCDCEEEDIVIGIFYDHKKQTLSYYKKGICQGVAFTNVQSGLYPSIDVWFETGTVTILQTKLPNVKKFM